ncbi:MAG TPA: NAD(P)H-dependent glycerol-3-phosphate dehydrogenase [Xanthomonadales bacterium]|nr:NAD(P)H-dependent glycerol-3-phosphate dehydrogenase [Xanthomonadales bacterium]
MGGERPEQHDGQRRVAVFGAGSWGTALAMQIARCGHQSRLWGRDANQMQHMAKVGSNERFLPGLAFPEGMQPESSFDHLVEWCDEVLVAVPSHAFTDLVTRFEGHLSAGQGVAWACKGLEPGSGRFLHTVAREILGDDTPLAVVTGPSFAAEVARNLPTAVTVAATKPDYAVEIASIFHGGSFRAYTSADIVGAELGGAVKNVLAVATGICDGMGFGDNARAALITRGLAEMMRLGRALGAEDKTLTGLAGMGDLVLTCTGDLSRNRRLGLALGKGADLQETLDQIGQVVEGVGTCEEVIRLGQRNQVELPISEQVHGIIHLGWNPSEGVRRLLAREQKSESD